MIRSLILSFALVTAPAAPAAVMSFSTPLRQMRPFPAILAKLGVAPVPADTTPADSIARQIIVLWIG